MGIQPVQATKHRKRHEAWHVASLAGPPIHGKASLTAQNNESGRQHAQSPSPDVRHELRDLRALEYWPVPTVRDVS